MKLPGNAIPVDDQEVLKGGHHTAKELSESASYAKVPEGVVS